MKIEILAKEKVFEPIELKISIENEIDLAWLYAIANSNKLTAKNNAKDDFKISQLLENNPVDGPQMKFFNAINKIAKDNDLV